jgi:hypothetical protein
MRSTSAKTSAAVKSREVKASNVNALF